METPPPTEITPLPLSDVNAASAPSRRLQNRVAIVTGGATSIGRAICIAYHGEGAKVVVADMQPVSRDPEEKEPTHEMIKRLGGEAIFMKVDVTDAAAVDKLVEDAVLWGGRLDIMVNNAGVSIEANRPQPIWAAEDSTWDKTIAINGTGVFYGCRAASRQMIKQDPLPGGDRGWIVNLSSIYGQVALLKHSAYVSSKHLVMGLTKTAALDLSPYQVHVNAICPGFTHSSMSNPHFHGNPENTERVAKLHPMLGLGQPQYIARVAVFLASEDAKWVQGHGLLVDGGFVIQ